MAIIIPDSPRHARRTLRSNGVDMDTSESEAHAPRAESPELISTPPQYLRQPLDAAPSSGQRNGDGPDPEAHLDLALQVSMPLSESFSKHEEHPANLGDHDLALGGGVLPEALPPSSPKITPQPPRLAPLPSTRSNSSLREFAGSSFLPSTPDDSFDPISTDTENPRSKSWLSSFKRLKTKSKRLQPSPQVVSTRSKDSASVGEEFVNPRSLGQEAESPISPGSATNTKGNSKQLQYLPQADSMQFEEPVTVNEESAKPVPPEKKVELLVPSESGGSLTQEPPQPSPAEPLIVNKVTLKPIPSQKEAEPHVPSRSDGSLTQEPPQPSPEEPVTVNKLTVRPISPEKKAEPHIHSESGGSITKEPRQPSPEVGPSRPQISVTMIEEIVMLKPSGKEVEAGAPSASTSSTSAKKKRSQPLPQADPSRSQKVASSAEAAAKSKLSDTKLGGMTPLSSNRSQLQPWPQASSARVEESKPVAESVVQPKASKEIQVAASAESSKDKGRKVKANGAIRTTKKPNGAAAGEKMLADRKAEKSVRKPENIAKDEEPKLKVVIRHEEKVEGARIADTRPKSNTLDENVSVKEHNLVGLTTDSLPTSSLRRSRRSRPTLNSPGARSEDFLTTPRSRDGPGSPPGDLTGDSGTPLTRRKEQNRTDKPLKPVVLNDGTDQTPEDELRWTAINSTTKAVKTLAGTVDTRILSEPSSPRGPAQYMSRPHPSESLTSVSSSGSDSDSQDDMVLLRQAVTPAKTKPEQVMKSLGPHVSNSRVLANTEGSIGKGPVSKTAHSPISISSRNSDSSEGTGSESHAEEPEGHLPLKPRRDMDSSILIPNSPPRGRSTASSAPVPRRLDYSANSRSILDDGSTPVPSKANPKGERPPSSSAPGGSRPFNSRYPSMTDLIKKPRPTEQSRLGKISPPKSTAGGTGAFPFHSFSGSSSSETSSSEDDD